MSRPLWQRRGSLPDWHCPECGIAVRSVAPQAWEGSVLVQAGPEYWRAEHLRWHRYQDGLGVAPESTQHPEIGEQEARKPRKGIRTPPPEIATPAPVLAVRVNRWVRVGRRAA
jgi:hypothetical protein